MRSVSGSFTYKNTHIAPGIKKKEQKQRKADKDKVSSHQIWTNMLQKYYTFRAARRATRYLNCT